MTSICDETVGKAGSLGHWHSENQYKNLILDNLLGKIYTIILYVFEAVR